MDPSQISPRDGPIARLGGAAQAPRASVRAAREQRARTMTSAAWKCVEPARVSNVTLTASATVPKNGSTTTWAAERTWVPDSNREPDPVPTPNSVETVTSTTPS